MEVLAAVGVISNVVQLVSFSSQVISKTIEIGRDADGALVENTAIQSATDHLVLLKDEVETSAKSTGDSALEKLCQDVTTTSSDLIAALQKLKAGGGKWKTMRKALRSVWSKDKIHGLEHRLASFREELNLHIVVKIRSQLNTLQSNVQSYSSQCDSRTKDILNAILDQRDVFDTVLEAHMAGVRELGGEITTHTEEQHKDTRLSLTKSISSVNATNQAEHKSTRESMSSQAFRATKQHETVLTRTEELVKSSEVEVIGVLTVSNQEEHEHTRSQIDELKEALRILKEQMYSRDQELKELLKLFNSTRSAKERKKLGERSNAVTAALFALESMYRSLRAVLVSLQAGAKEFLDTARTSAVWKVTRYPIAQESRPPVLVPASPYSDEGEDERTGAKVQKFVPTNFPHQVYMGYFYNWINDLHRGLIDVQEMQSQWESNVHLESSESQAFSNFEGFAVDELHCFEPSLWLLGAVATSLSIHISPESATSAMIAEVFDRRGKRKSPKMNHHYSHGPGNSRLQADLQYWRYFAQTRGLHLNLSNDKFAFEALSIEDKDELYNLIVWLIGFPRGEGWTQTKTTVKIRGEVGEIVVQSLLSMGLRITWHLEHNLVSHSDMTPSNIIGLNVNKTPPRMDVGPLTSFHRWDSEPPGTIYDERHWDL